MKKRTIISVILTIVFVFLTNKLWITYESLPISFDVSGGGSYKTVIEAAKNSSRLKGATARFELTSNAQHVNIELSRMSRLKYLKFKFRRVSAKSGTIVLSNIKLSNIQIEPKDFENFKTKSADLVIKGDSIEIIPTQTKFELIYNKRMNFKFPVKVDVFLLISLTVLAYLLSYKLTSYIADFKTEKHYSRLDIIFLVIFVIFLYIPMSHIDKREVSPVEKRTLAKLPKLKNAQALNLQYGKELNDWFNDRFAMRRIFIDVNHYTGCFLNQNICKTPRNTFYKKYNLFATGSFWGLPQAEPEIRDAEIKKYYTGAIKLDEYCRKNNIKLYVLIVPRQSDFFNYEYPDRTFIDKDFTDDIVEYIRAHSDIHIIYPKEEMQKANKKTPVYYKTDHHWTKKGAYVGYYELMKEIKKDYPKVKILEESSLDKYYDKRVKYWWNAEFTEGQSLMQSHLPEFFTKKVLDTDYVYYKNPNRSKLQVGNFTKYTDSEITVSDEEFYYSDGSDIRTLLIGNSFGRNLVEFLPYSFKHTLRLYDNFRHLNFDEYKPLIQKFKPDIIVINYQSHAGMQALLDLYEQTID